MEILYVFSEQGAEAGQSAWGHGGGELQTGQGAEAGQSTWGHGGGESQTGQGAGVGHGAETGHGGGVGHGAETGHGGGVGHGAGSIFSQVKFINMIFTPSGKVLVSLLHIIWN